jgi:hypothetical protein
MFLKNFRAWWALSNVGSDLVSSGWAQSVALRKAVDHQGEPIPWITYSSLDFLRPLVRRDMHVFEYGSGSSTLWWAQRVEQVIACEHDREWYEKTLALVPSNVQLVHADVGSQQYSREILKYESAFDIVVIDGRDRIGCAKNAVSALKHNGIILWDNSDRAEYREGFEFLRNCNFRRIDFTGMGPINIYAWCTSVFYRDENCLGL